MMPSNMIAAHTVVPHKVFPNLARGQTAPVDVVAEVTATCEAELKTAGIQVHIWETPVAGEVPSLAVGLLRGWRFERRWYYWAAHGPGIPPLIAEVLHKAYGREVRVEGHCGCPSPLEWCKGFAVGSYHIDTQEGLNALAETIRSITPEAALRQESHSG